MEITVKKMASANASDLAYASRKIARLKITANRSSSLSFRVHHLLLVPELLPSGVPVFCIVCPYSPTAFTEADALSQEPSGCQ